MKLRPIRLAEPHTADDARRALARLLFPLAAYRRRRIIWTSHTITPPAGYPNVIPLDQSTVIDANDATYRILSGIVNGAPVFSLVYGHKVAASKPVWDPHLCFNSRAEFIGALEQAQMRARIATTNEGDDSVRVRGQLATSN